MRTRVILTLVWLICASAVGADATEITVKLTVPDSTWAIAVDEVYKVGNELWIICTVSRSQEMMGAQVISTVQASLKLAVPDSPATYFVIGKTWDWKNEEPYIFIEDLKQIEKELKYGELLYKADKQD